MDADGGADGVQRPGSRIVRGILAQRDPVVDLEVEVVVADAPHEVEAIRERDHSLSEDPDAPDRLGLVDVGIPRGASIVVVELATIVVLDVPVDARLPAYVVRRGRVGAAHGEPGSTGRPLHVDDVEGNGVREVPGDAVDQSLRRDPAQGAGPSEAELTLLELLPRLVSDVDEVVDLLTTVGQPVDGPRVLGVQVDVVEGDSDVSTGQGTLDAAVDVEPVGGAVAVAGVGLPKAVVGEPIDAQEVARLTRRSAGQALEAEHTVAAAHDRDVFPNGHRRRGLALEAEDASRGISVEGGCRAAEGFHPTEGSQVQVVDGRLAVGEGGRNAVHHDVDSPDAELGPGAEAPEQDPLTHRVVVAVLDLDAGKSLERLLEEHAGLPLAQLLLTHHRDGIRGLAEADGRAEHRHHERVQVVAG